ncbi:substrate-binding domain-containing protein [Streptomyces sp. GMY02]|uniref:substrate-binding domain-containing protein n=1 Tax=Streptomyces sp. GMY02 TaxID=1333528 RepID=UPI001C2CBD54|nr:substrate-binding domain-containing protein [Streptomyces sp. GMY02]QXE34680.1 substrate-binding domain-containing protein [Streptomyces sp. GMY02]
MNVKSRIRMAAAVGAVAMGLSLFATPASADSETRQIVGVGSDTTQDVVNGLGEVILDPNGSPDNQLIQSYNATGTGSVTCRVGGSIARPNGSSAGIDALRNDLTNTSIDCVDFARSSRGPVDFTTTRLTWVPFAKDAVTVAVRSDSALNTPALNLTTAQLKLIYTCDPSLRVLNGVTLTPLLPQTGSGTRTFFLEKIGVTEAQIGSCVDGTVQEHNGLALDSAGDIAPYSIAQYIAQTGGVVPDRHGVTVLGKVNSVAPQNADGTLNVNFPYNRDVYNVVPTAKIDGGTTPDDADLKKAFVGGTSDVCLQTDVINAYGFGTIANCGDVSVKAER